MIQMRPFKREDWYGFAGATSFKDGVQPLIGTLSVILDDSPANHLAEAVVVLDAEQLCLHILNVDEDAREDYLEVFVSFDGMYAARALATIRDGLTLTELRAMPGAEELQ